MDAREIRGELGRKQVAEEPVGQVLAVTGSQATIGLLERNGASFNDAQATVGRFLEVATGKSQLIGVITNISIEIPAIARERGYHAAARVDLVGEIMQEPSGAPMFQRGVATYPAIGDRATLLTGRKLRLIHEITNAKTIEVGHLQHDDSIGALLRVDELLNKHFAILGATGVGKSSGVVLILREIIKARPDLRVFLIDAHNEYGRCFEGRAQVLTPGNLKLPFWLFNFEELIDALFGGRPGIEEEVDILFELIPLAKAMYGNYRAAAERSMVKRIDPRSSGYTADTPVPYRLADLVALIDERMGKLENRSARLIYHRLITRIETVSADPRYAFMFANANVGGDTMGEVLGSVFRLPANGVPMTIMQLAGFPAEAVDAVVSVLCRMAFDFGLWSDGASPLLFVCEEAHRYAAADRTIGFGPTRRAISRIAKEGRKYGVFLGLVSQRPAELDPTIISQCSTLFAMRMANDRDQAILRSAVSDAAANLLAFVPTLGTREALAFGEGAVLPIRLRFKELPAGLLRKECGDGHLGHGVTPDFLGSVIERWRGSSMSHRLSAEDASADPTARTREEITGAPPTAPAAPTGLDNDRFKILKKPLEAQPELAAPAQREVAARSSRFPFR
jgi:uncharacterized protein